MSAITNQPTNINFLSPLNFKFTIKKTPTTNYFVKAINLPEVGFMGTEVPTPFVKIPFPSTALTYGTLRLQFGVDEDMKNYLEIHNWLVGMGFPDNFDQYKDLVDGDPKIGRNKRIPSGSGVFSDATLMILTSSKNPNLEITFVDLFPISLSQLVFDTTNIDVQYLDAVANFRYRKYNITKL